MAQPGSRFAGKFGLSLFVWVCFGLLLPSSLAAEILAPVVGEFRDIEIAENESLEYTLRLTSNQVAELTLHQESIDVEVIAYTPDGERFMRFESAVRVGGPERVYLLSEQAGDWKLDIHSYRPNASGKFTIRVDRVETANAEDALRIEAEKQFEQARELRAKGDAPGRAKSIELFSQALRHYERFGDVWRLADCRTYLGGLLQLEGRPEEAIAYYREALPSLTQTDQIARVGLTWMNMGWAFDQLAQFGDALHALEQARSFMEREGSLGGKAGVLASEGRIYQAVGAIGLALSRHRESKRLWEEAGIEIGVAIGQQNLGLVYESSGEPLIAIDLITEARDRFVELGNEGRIAQANLHLCRLQYQLAEPQSGPECDDAAAIYERRGDRKNLASVARALAERSRREGRLAEALRTFEDARDQSREISDGAGEAEALYGIARAADQLGETDRARDAMSAALQKIDHLLRGIDGSSLRDAFRASNHDYETFMVSLLAKQSVNEETLFAAVEQARGRTLLEALELRSSGVSVERSTPDLERVQSALNEGEEMLIFTLLDSGVLSNRVTPDGFQTQLLPADMVEVRDRVKNFSDLIARGDAASWQPIGRMIARDLGLDSIELPEHLVIVADDVLHYLPFDALTIDDEGTLLIERTAVSYAPSAAVWERLRSESVRMRPQDGEVWIFAAPDGVTGDILEEEPVRRQSNLDRLAREGFTFEPLPFAGSEARSIARIFQDHRNLYIGETATERAVRSRDGLRGGVLHFATHGFASRWGGFDSALLLDPGPDGDDGLLNVDEIRRLSLDETLVVLSACSSAQGPLMAGEGMQGLARAFLLAGARTVVATLWSVQDKSTATLMRGFYRRLAEGLPAHEALRRAKLERMRDPETARPIHWAGFISVGDPGGADGGGSESTGAERSTGALIPALLAGLALLAVVAVVIRAVRKGAQ